MSESGISSSLSAVAASPSGHEVFVMPCTVAQKRFWVLEQINPGNTALYIPIALRLSGPLDAGLLERALNAVVERHEILRTHFASVEGEPRQVIAPQAVLRLERIDLGDLPPEQHPERIRQEMLAEVERKMSIDTAPLLRATLVRLAPRESVLMLTAHHIISDGWSSGVLIREIAAFYDAFRRDQPIALAPLPLQYADYAVWQEEWLKTDEFRKQLDYWRETLRGDLPALDFPTDFPRQAVQSNEAFLESLLLPASLTGALQPFCLREGVTLFMVFFTAYVALLRRYTGQEQVLVGTTAANRNKPELENLIGLFANLLILRCDCPGRLTFRELLQQQRDRALAGFAHHEAPFEKVLEELQQKRKGGAQALLQTHFLFQKAFMQPAACGELDLRPLHSVSPGSTFELTFGIVERAEGIRLQMEYRLNLFAKSTIRRLLLHFQALLECVMAHPETPIDELSLFAEGEREELEAGLLSLANPPAGAEVKLDPAALLADLNRQLDRHLQKQTTPFTSPVDLPAAAVLIVLDDRLRLAPRGIAGHVYLAVPGFAGEPAAGLARLLGPADSASPVPLLNTGLVGRHAETGGVELWGRSEDIVRLGSFRFNRRAVELKLRLHPAVADAAVAVHPLQSDPTRPTGYAVLRPGAAATEEELRAFLRGKVGDLELPAAILVVPSLPRDDRGRIEIEKLPAPEPRSPGASSSESAPPGPLQAQLLELWREMLRAPSLGLEDNFFECGGSSFLALAMMHRVEKICGRPLPLSLLLTGATIANLSRHIIETQGQSEAATPLIPLQTQGSRPPLFFLHGDWAGGGFYCRRLAQVLGAEQPFYVLPPYRLPRESILSMRDMAAYHLDAVRKQSPRGPYVLGGYCIGATIAMEMGAQLVDSGETVSLLLVDPPVWGGDWLRWVWPVADRIGRARRWNLERRIDFFDRYAVSVNRWLKRPLAGKLATLRRRLGMKEIESSPGRAAAANDDFADESLLDGLDYSIYFLAYRLYRLQPLSVPATLFFPETTPARQLKRLARASRMDPARYRIEIVPGNHSTCITTHAAELAEKMKTALGPRG